MASRHCWATQPMRPILRICLQFSHSLKNHPFKLRTSGFPGCPLCFAFVPRVAAAPFRIDVKLLPMCKHPLAGAFHCIIVLALTAAAAFAQQDRKAPAYDIVIHGGRIVDGTGNPWYAGDVAIRGDRIVAIGKLPSANARRVIDATGMVSLARIY